MNIFKDFEHVLFFKINQIQIYSGSSGKKEHSLLQANNIKLV